MDSSKPSIFAATATVFLVEDNPTDSYLSRMAMERTIAMPLQIVAADTGEYALELLRHHCSNHKCPNVVLLDLSLPDISGHEVLAQVRAEPLLKDVPVVILTGSDDPEDQRRAREAGASDYWIKPMGMIGYMDIMRRLRGYLDTAAR
jgi:CheY-like chemotaxis protein